MSSDYSPSSDRRSSRRGGRSRGGRSRGSSHSSRQETPSKPKKLTLWQKIAGFFTGKGATSSAGHSSSSTRTSSSTARQENRPERQERSERSERPARAERPSGFRKPEIVEVTSARIYVGNLSFDATESDLVELFNGVGAVQNVEIVSNKYTQKSKGFAFVQMQGVDEAKRAVDELHDKEYMGRKLVVSGAKAVEEKRSERSRPAEEPAAERAEKQPGQSTEQ